jgi:hypothetical protein
VASSSSLVTALQSHQTEPSPVEILALRNQNEILDERDLRELKDLNSGYLFMNGKVILMKWKGFRITWPSTACAVFL